MPNNYPAPKEQLSHLFGSYKAEWLKEQLFDLFTEPSYFPELETSRPCILVGGRGTGKTTVLKSLSYSGQFALKGRTVSRISEFPYFGFYYRVNTNRVSAFRGPELQQTSWIGLFGHYMNLLLCGLTVEFLLWYELHTSSALGIPQARLDLIADSLNLIDLEVGPESPVSNSNKRFRSGGARPGGTKFTRGLLDFSERLSRTTVKFEAYINNVVDAERPLLSMQGAPVDAMFETLRDVEPFWGKNFFFLIDEYENFEPYQQQVVNTLIKHSGQLYTFKIGVRELGIKEKATLNPDEQLISPSDYVKINIVDKLAGDTFKNFALEVCNERIKRVETDPPILRDVVALLPNLSEDEEAELLGIKEHAIEVKSHLLDVMNADFHQSITEMSDQQLYFLKFWSEGHSLDLESVAKNYFENRKTWNETYQNYKHATLFTIRKGKSGIHKYYCGWDVFTKLAANNIRYLLELVDQSLIQHLSEEGNLSVPVGPDTQTRAAQAIGKKNLSELEGLTVYGAQLTKLLLSLGRIYQVMAVDAWRHAPEVNQFHISDQNLSDEVSHLLTSAVMHLALLRFPGNKLANENETREYDFMVHPIFSAFFEFSYRRKRKMTITGEQLIGLVKRPRSTIREILARTNRSLEDQFSELPEQMRLFEGYYYGDIQR